MLILFLLDYIYIYTVEGHNSCFTMPWGGLLRPVARVARVSSPVTLAQVLQHVGRGAKISESNDVKEPRIAQHRRV